MKRSKLRREELDRLLRRTLGDELPPPEELRLRAWMRATWAELRAAGGGSVFTRAPFPLFASRSGPALGAAASLLVVGLGLALHLMQPPRLVAASLSVNNASLRAASQLRKALAMTGLVETRNDEGLARRYRIEWRAPDAVHVTLEEAWGTQSWSLTVAPDSGGFGGAGSASRDPEANEPRLDVVRPLLSPDRVAGLLAGRWDLVGRDERGRATTFDVTGRRGVRVTIEADAGLPVRLESGWSSTLFFTPGLEATPPLAVPSPKARPGGSR